MIWRALSKFLVNDVITFAKKATKKSGKSVDRREKGCGEEVKILWQATRRIRDILATPPSSPPFGRSYTYATPWHLSWLLANLHTFSLWFNPRENRMPSYRNTQKKRHTFVAKIFWHFSATSSWLIARVLLFWKNPKKKIRLLKNKPGRKRSVKCNLDSWRNSKSENSQWLNGL